MTIITIRRLSSAEEEETNTVLLDGRLIESDRAKERVRGGDVGKRERERHKQREKGRG